MGGAIPAVRSVAASPDFLDQGPPSREGNRWWLEAMQHAVRPPREPHWTKVEQLMTQVLKLGWDGQRPFKELALQQLKPRIDEILQEKPRSTPQSMWAVALGGALVLVLVVGLLRHYGEEETAGACANDCATGKYAKKPSTAGSLSHPIWSASLCSPLAPFSPRAISA